MRRSPPTGGSGEIERMCTRSSSTNAGCTVSRMVPQNENWLIRTTLKPMRLTPLSSTEWLKSCEV